MQIRTASLSITPEMLGLIAEFDEFKGAWRALGPSRPNDCAGSVALQPSRASAPPDASKEVSCQARSRPQSGGISQRHVHDI